MPQPPVTVHLRMQRREGKSIGVEGGRESPVFGLSVLKRKRPAVQLDGDAVGNCATNRRSRWEEMKS